MAAVGKCGNGFTTFFRFDLLHKKVVQDEVSAACMDARK